jgi:hypothetical protein
VVAVVLAHELRHALDLGRVVLVMLDRDCLALRSEGLRRRSSSPGSFGRTRCRPGPNWTAISRLSSETTS